jgi:ribosome maturation protein Sdo1
MVIKSVVAVVVVEGMGEKEKGERRKSTRCKKEKEKNRGVWLVFCQLWTRFALPFRPSTLPLFIGGGRG